MTTQDQLGNASLDVGYDLLAIVRIFISLVEVVQIAVQNLVGVNVEYERDARYADFFALFHNQTSYNSMGSTVVILSSFLP